MQSSPACGLGRRVVVLLVQLLSWTVLAVKEFNTPSDRLAPNSAGEERYSSSETRRRRAAAAQVLADTERCPAGEVPWPIEGGGYTCEAAEAAAHRSKSFLRANLPPWDVINQGTLEEALLPLTVELALQVRSNFSWAASVPSEVWFDYVLPYANVNEARENWRALMLQTLTGLVSNATFEAGSLREVAEIVNQHVWSFLRPGEAPIHFKAQQTPLIYDPMSTITFGFASCTGVSILYIDALRSVGVPARLVGTPAWHGVEADGNHNWVEIWLGPGEGLSGEPWTFTEAQPAGPGEKLENPCDKWFCNAGHFNGSTVTYAARFNRSSTNGGFLSYPMAWDPNNTNIPGVNRTSFYNAICGKC
mmetsp:Transcript_52219/g.124495  ORF Transcript_52219/g.124495 Transcript_52219/m.124495 type:complete len:362 (-) Transcript_52219:5-1090(-)